MKRRIAIVGPVFPYRAGIAYCTTKTAEELAKRFDVEIVSFARQYPRRFYPGKDDRDPTLAARTPARARFTLDIINPFTWFHEAMWLRRSGPEAVVLVWWVWVWALPYLVLLALLPRATKVVLQCHNVSDKEPARWKTWLTNLVLRRGDFLIVHAESEAVDAERRTGGVVPVIRTFLPVHELGGEIPTREQARKRLRVQGHVALFFGHVRPFKGLDIALRAWAQLEGDVLLLVAGEVWWNDEQRYRDLARELSLAERVRFDFRFIPDDEVAWYFAAADVVVTPYRTEAQSGVALTAFHFARPVIATTVGGVPEIIDEGVNGLLVPPENPEALAAAVDAFFASGDRSAMELGAAASAAKYSWSRYGSMVSETITQGDR